MKKAIVKTILKVFAVGCAAALLNAAAGVMGWLSATLFVSIPNVNGYLAILYFLLAIAAAVAALLMICTCGMWIMRKGRFSK